MKKKLSTIVTVAVTTLLLCCAVVFAGCQKEKSLTDSPLNAAKIGDFTQTAEDRSEFFESNGWENGEPFNAYWKAENVSYEGNKMSLSISEMAEKPDNAVISQYFAGEARSTHYYGYGDFQVRMKPSKVVGTASTFFTCTGPYDKWYDESGAVTKENDHDEIDIEFLGKDTTKVQFNYFASGVGGHEYMYDLGFDASEEYHDYGFRWTKDDITWFVDQKPVYKVKRSEIKAGEEWPEEPGRVIMNYWSGTEKASKWMGEFKDDYTGRSEYQWAATSAQAQKDPNSTKPSGEASDPIPADITWDANTFIDFADMSNVYTLTKDQAAKKINVAYTAVARESWANIKAAVTAPGRNHFGVTLTGKTDKEAQVRINIMDSEKNITKKSYVSAGSTSVEDGALVTVPANGSVDVVVYYEGTLASIELMIDSTNKAPAAANANQVEISNMKFGVKGEVIESEVGKNKGIKVNDNVVKFTGTGYDIESSEDKSSMTVKYTDLSGKGYANIFGDTSSFIGDNNTFTFKITNNGAETAKVRVDISCPKPNGTNGNDFCNTSAVITGALDKDGVGNDYAYGGADWLKIAAGKTATVTITFSTGVGANGIRLFIDSSTYNDETTHTGELLFSEMAFSVVVA